MNDDAKIAGRWARWARLVVNAATIVLLFLALAIGPAWVWVWYHEYVPRWVSRGATVAFLQTLRAFCLVALVGSILGVIGLSRALMRARRRRRPTLPLARGLALCVSTLLGLALLEAGAAVYLAWEHRLPNLPTQFPADDPDRSSGELRLLMVGESSALGVPYQPWVTVAKVVAWRLEQLLPGRRVTVEVQADGGICLEQAVARLLSLKRRPNALLLFCGHNEFQARFGWSRNVAYYQDENPRFLSIWNFERWNRLSSFSRLIEEALDRNRIDEPPPPGARRELVDHPSFKPAEYAFLRWDFERRLEGLARYCETIGALPILIVPPGNEGASAPNRSYALPRTAPAERAEIVRAFQAARTLEARDPEAAEAAYRALLARQPTLAEVHYRLALLREQAGDIDDANRHFGLARDFDGMPMRCPSDFQRAFFEVAARHNAILVDGPAVLRRVSPRGVLDDHLFHDPQHPTFRGYLALADEVLRQLVARRAFGLPAGTLIAPTDPDACARYCGLDAARWAQVCRRESFICAREAELHYDPTAALYRADAYSRAALEIAEGRSPDEVGITGLGLHPQGLREVPTVRGGR
jgi:hypothetical protein